MSVTRGRPRKPVALKKMEGTYRKDRARKDAPAPKVGALPAPPDHFTEREKRCWRYMASLIDPLKVATPADVVAFEQLVLTYSIIHEARDALRSKDDLTYEQSTQNGTVERRRPELDIIKDFKKQLSVDLSRFGLTPADRERVSAAGEDGGADPLDEFAVGGPSAKSA